MSGIKKSILTWLKDHNDRAAKNIYHCCIQRSGSQWIRQILADPIIRKGSRLQQYTPGKDFILARKHQSDLKNGFPPNTIVSPLYIKYEDFLKMPKPADYSAFWIMRDPRDLIVSRYFAARYSHPIANQKQQEERDLFDRSDIDEGISYLIEAMTTIHKPLYSSLTSWLRAEDNPAVMLCKYEALTGNDQYAVFQKILDHCGIAIKDEELSRLLNTYSFAMLAKGRTQGTEEQTSHYRKGISGDWKNYFNNQHKALFKSVAGELLITLGYEKDGTW